MHTVVGFTRFAPIGLIYFAHVPARARMTGPALQGILMQISVSKEWLIAILLVQITGFYTLWQQNRAHAPRTSIILQQPAAGSTDSTKQTDIAALIRNILREELAVARQSYADAVLSKAQVAQASTSEENLIAMDKGTAIIESALTLGKWSQSDNLTIMQLVGNLNMQQRMVLLDKISTAINRGELDLEATPPPL
jgi:hypothetical protein